MTITVFEHETLYLDKAESDNGLSAELYEDLLQFYGEGIPYFTLVHKGIRFCEYVGVLQIGRTTIEILPKADKQRDETRWRNVLIDMLRTVGALPLHTPTSGSFQLKPHSILDLYIELLIDEMTLLMHEGLIKKYRQQAGNVHALKGNLMFSGQLKHNIVHPERFYTVHSTYDDQHLLHQILFTALQLVAGLPVATAVKAKINKMMFDFPEQRAIQVTERTFEMLILTRKTRRYQTAIDISRLLLLNYHPNVITGKNHVLALLFDMNLLWERFVLQSLRERLPRKIITIHDQDSKAFWRPEKGQRQTIRPDIILNKGKHDCAVLDTKWKDIKTANPSPDDLRQLYVYHEYYQANRVALIYPCEIELRKGAYYTFDSGPGTKECSVMGIKCVTDLSKWKKNIAEQVLKWLKIVDY